MALEMDLSSPSPEEDGDLRGHEASLLALIESLRKLGRDFKLAASFNVFDALAIQRQETKHSRFLAFLLDPTRPHGLGHVFLRGILATAVADHPEPPVSRLDVAIADLAGCTVHCERDHFDITVEVPSLQLLFVIENKIDASEGDGQLRKYRERAEARYQDYRFMGTFLTLAGYDGEDERWGSMGYATVIAELKTALEVVSPPVDVAMTVAHYIEMVERNIVPSQALIDACKQIYREHRIAVDLVVQHGGQQSVTAQAFDQFVQDLDLRGVLRSVSIRSDRAIFVFDHWLSIKGVPKTDRVRWSSDFPLQMAFEVRGKRLWLRLQVGPFLDTDTSRRQQLVASLRDTLAYKKRAGERGEVYATVAVDDTVIPEDADSGALADAMKKLWKTAEPKEWGQVVGKALTPPPAAE